MVLVAIIRSVYMLPIRLKWIRRLLMDPKLTKSYYPQEPRKSKFRILLELLWYLLRHQEVNYEYYYYGFDRREGVDPRDFLTSEEFRTLRDRANIAQNTQAIRGDKRGRKLNYRLLLGDKFAFNQYIKGLGFRVPQIVALGDQDYITWMDTGTRLPLESILERNLDCFWKECIADGGGRVYPFRVNDGQMLVAGEPETMDQLRRRIAIGGHYILQQRIEQHPKMLQLNPDCVSTVRIVTTLSNGCLGAVLRMGCKSSVTGIDNWSVGGIAAAIDLETGRLGKYGFFKPGKGTKTDRHPDTGVIFAEFQVPLFSETLAEACRLHSFFYGFHSIGWDIAITRDGPTFIEGNDDWSRQLLQGTLGGMKKRFLAMLPGE